MLCEKRRAPGAAGFNDTILQDVRARTGVPINWQVTRHTWATDLLEAKYSVRYLQKLGGWHNLTHLSRYAEARAGPVEASYRHLSGIDPWSWTE